MLSIARGHAAKGRAVVTVLSTWGSRSGELPRSISSSPIFSGRLRKAKESVVSYLNAHRTMFKESQLNIRLKVRARFQSGPSRSLVSHYQPKLFNSDMSDTEVRKRLVDVLSTERWDTLFRRYAEACGSNYNDTKPEKWKGENDCESMSRLMQPLLNIMGLKPGVSKYMESRLVGQDFKECRRHAWLTLKAVGEKKLKDPIVIDPTIWQFIERDSVPEEFKVGTCFVGPQSDYFGLLKDRIDIKESDYTAGESMQFEYYEASKSAEGVKLPEIALFGWNRTSEHVSKVLSILKDVESFSSELPCIEWDLPEPALFLNEVEVVLGE